jgi:conjugal transfer pilus assembly protein TraF
MKLKFRYLPSLFAGAMAAAFILGGTLAQAQDAAWWSNSIWQNPQRGSVWYPPAKVPQPDEPPVPTTESSVAPRPAELDEFDRIQKRLSELRNIAIVNPSEANLKAYIAFQEEQMQRASVFADQWRRTLWSNPDLKYEGRPVNVTGIASFDTNYGQQVRNSLSQLANTHGLYFFFRSDCPFCHSMAPTLKLLEQTHGIRVIAISLDGGTLPQFPNATTDKGQAQALGVRSVPSYFLASPRAGSVHPLGTGVLSLGTLEDRIYTQAFTQPGSKF